MDLFQAIKILELESCEDHKDLKMAFAKKVHQYHPDKNPSAASQAHFRKVVTAYEFLGANFDLVLEHFGTATKQKESAYQKAKSSDNLDDIFSEMFGFSATGEGIGYFPPQKVLLELSELFSGASRFQKMKIYKRCEPCHGQGTAWVERPKICRYCFGQGAVTLNSETNERRICPRCHGRGKDIRKACKSCDGFGQRVQTEKLRFDLPKNLVIGEVLSIQAYDEKTNFYHDIEVEIAAKDDEIFKIANSDLICQYAIDFKENNFWKKTYVLNTPEGESHFQVSQNAKPGDEIVLKGQGLPFKKPVLSRGDIRILLNKKKSFFERVWGGLFES